MIPVTADHTDRDDARWYKSPTRIGVASLVIGGIALAATLPFSYGDGGSRATEGATPLLASLSLGGLALVVIGACVLLVSSSRRSRKRSGSD
jgi:hypothetical protein